ncbi:hypothetical protein ACFFP0_14480 [Rhizobium puerariae]|uniref:Uncharacterized protein n=1 Tax=Rhizobium puerariae TaxID=1585791 RepID=A0ABV6AHH4_9HYPH
MIRSFASLVSTLVLQALVNGRIGKRARSSREIGRLLGYPTQDLPFLAGAAFLEVNALRRSRAHYFPKRGKQLVNLGENFNLSGWFARQERGCCADGAVLPASSGSALPVNGMSRKKGGTVLQ